MKKEIVNKLETLVANTYSLYILTLHCHWNLVDPRFMFLHEMLEEQYNQLAENGDLIAERVRQMGFPMTASLKTFASKQQFDTIDADASADAMLGKLLVCHEKAIQDITDLSEDAEKAKDFGLVDLLGSVIRDHEKTAWILRSHL